MKAFTVVNDKVSEGIQFQSEPYPHIEVASRIPIKEGLAARILGDSIIEWASVLRLDKGTYMLVPEADPDDKRALVLLEITGCPEAISSAQSSMVRCPRRGEKMGGSCALCGQKAVTENQGLDYPIYIPRYVSVHPRYEGEVRQWKTLDFLEQASFSRGLFSIGRTLLVVLKPGDGVRTCVRSFFRLRERFIVWDGKGLRSGSFEQVFPPSAQPTDGGQLI